MLFEEYKNRLLAELVSYMVDNDYSALVRAQETAEEAAFREVRQGPDWEENEETYDEFNKLRQRAGY